MKKNGLVLLMMIFSLMMVLQSSNAQDSSASVKPWIQKGWSLGAHFGSNLAYSDVKAYALYPVSRFMNERKMAYGLNIGKELNSSVDLRVQLLMGSLAGVIRPSKITTSNPNNIYFATNMFEFNANAKINISNLISPEDDRKFNFYTYLGLGLNSFTSHLDSLRTQKNIVSYSKIAAVVPIGLGIEFAVSPSIKLSLDASLRFTTSDLIDGLVSKLHGGNDKYGYSSIGVTYMFGKAKKKEKPTVTEQAIQEPVVEPIKEDSVKIAVDSLVKDSAEINAAARLVKEKNEQIVADSIAKSSIIAPISESGAEAKVEPEVKVEPVAEVKPEVKSEPKPVQEPKTVAEPITSSKAKPAQSNSKSTSKLVVEYRVQITAMHQMSYNKVTKLKKQYAITEAIVEEHIDGWYKYTVGSYSTLEEAQKLKESFVSKGRTDVFIVAYNNGQRVTIAEAKALLKK